MNASETNLKYKEKQIICMLNIWLDCLFMQLLITSNNHFIFTAVNSFD